MKKITNLLMLLAVVLLAACEPIDTTVPTLEVKPYNLEGAWKLAEVDGSALAGDTYVYIVIDRKNGFEIYQNTYSMYPMLYTGTYELTYEWRYGDIISGIYDYEQGEWAHEYIVSDLYKESMTWTSKADAEKGEVAEVQKFVRVDAVPSDIVEAVRKQD